MEINTELLARIWAAISSRSPASLVEASLRRWEKAVQSGWLRLYELSDLLSDLDSRLDAHGIDASEIVGILKLPIVYVGTRPESRYDALSGANALAVADAAAVLIFVERLGFNVDAEVFCLPLRGKISQSTDVTESEFCVLFHHRWQHRMLPFDLATNACPDGEEAEPLLLSSGYRATLVLDEHGHPQRLTVMAPKYRPRPEPKQVTCEICGFPYMKGIPSDEKEHRKMHAQRLRVLEPKRSARLSKARLSDPDGALWVDWTAPSWKRRAVYAIASTFRREQHYDFVGWAEDGSYDQAAIGYLFADDENRIVGACCFRPLRENSLQWRLDWVWLCPGERRRGWLRNRWPEFRRRFGDFAVVTPLSKEMRAFLAAEAPHTKLC